MSRPRLLGVTRSVVERVTRSQLKTFHLWSVLSRAVVFYCTFLAVRIVFSEMSTPLSILNLDHSALTVLRLSVPRVRVAKAKQMKRLKVEEAAAEEVVKEVSDIIHTVMSN
jgi:hypothetical protein